VMDSGLGAKRRPGMTEEARLGMTMVDSLPLSRDSLRPSFAIDVLPPWLGGRRESRAQDAPAAPCARNGSTRVSSPQVHRKRSGFPCTMVYGLFRALPGDRLVCHRRLRVTRRLDASIGAPGPHDFAVRAGLVRLRYRPRPSHPAPACRDVHDTPLQEARDGWADAIDLGSV